MKISIAMATYNGASFLEEQLRTLENQYHQPFEVVINDDASQDATLDICRAFATRATFAVTIASNPTRVGWRRNFALAARRCKGDYVGFCDQDDVWLPQKLQRQAALIESTGATAVAHRVQMFSGASLRRDSRRPWHRHRRPSRMDVSLAYRGGFDGNNMVFRHDLRSWFAYQDELLDPLCEGPIAHDRLMMLAAMCVGDAWFSPETLVLFRRHASQVTARAGNQRAGADDYEHRSKALCSWVASLPRIALAENLPAGRGSKIEEAIGTFRDIAAQQGQRAHLYRANSGFDAASQFLTIYMSSSHRRMGRGRLGTRSFVKDLAIVGSKVAGRSSSSQS